MRCRTLSSTQGGSPSTAGSPNVEWTYTTGDFAESSPAVADGIVYFGSGDHKVYALDAATGQPRWTHVIGGAVVSSPALARGTIYIGNDNNVYALNSTG